MILERLKQMFVAPEDGAPALGPAMAAAALMFEVAWADHDIQASEVDTMHGLLERLFGLDRAAVEELVEDTRQAHQQSVGAYEFTRVLNESLNEDQKYAVVEALWRIAYASEGAHALEEHVIRRVADLLYLPHRRFIDAKRAAR